MEGILFPKTSSTERSTQITGKNIFAAAIGEVNTQVASKTRGEKDWRKKYSTHLSNVVRLSSESTSNSLFIAKSGLDFCYKNFEFLRDGQTFSLENALKKIIGTFHVGYIKGNLSEPEDKEVIVPYKGKKLAGEELETQLDKWVEYGTIEPTCSEYIKQVMKNKKWTNLKNKYFVLLGAGSAMGPLIPLLKLGANVVATDLNRPSIWERLLRIARESAGTLTFPLSIPQTETTEENIYSYAGCNLLTQTPEIKNWLLELYPESEFIVGSYAYLDGDQHVRVSLAMDAIVSELCQHRSNISISYLNTPTLCYVIPEATAEASMNNYYKFNLFNFLMAPLRLFSPRLLDRNIKIDTQPNGQKKDTVLSGTLGQQIFIVNGIVVQQGPNYALAKMIQLWRCTIEKMNGITVSSNVAPSSYTLSVVNNKSFSWAYGGYSCFEPIEIFQQETSNSVMCMLLLNDINNQNCNASKSIQLNHPWDLFKDGAFHGGVWRCGYSMGSTGEIAAVLYFLKKIRFVVYAASVIIIALIISNINKIKK